jgi:hypothetical protein
VTIDLILKPLRAALSVWDRLWFQDQPTPQLDLIRAGLGLAMFTAFAFLTPRVPELYASGGWVPIEAVSIFIKDPWRASVFFTLTSPSQVMAFHYFFLAACFCLCVGFATPLVKWVALIGEISYGYRCPPVTYGVDEILPSLLLILCLAPVGRRWSVDALIRRAWACRRGRPLRPRSNRWGFACARLMQIQMAVMFLISGLHKVRGGEWWSGDALWHALTNYQFYAPMDFFAENYWLINLLTHGTLAVEIGYVFMIWGRRRAVTLGAAVGLHVGIAMLMNLHYFSFVNIMGHVSFLRPEWIESAIGLMRRVTGRARPGYSAQDKPSPTIFSSICS